MKHISWYSFFLVAIFLFAPALMAETEGTLHGELLSAPQGKQAETIINLAGRDGNVLSIVVTHAIVEYDASAADQTKPAGSALVPGAEVAVTAMLDPQSGEWTASRIQVIPNHAGEFEADYGDVFTEGHSTAPNTVAAPSKPVNNSRTI
jgi:hypothetical protein